MLLLVLAGDPPAGLEVEHRPIPRDDLNARWYLDNNPTLSRKEMEQYPALKGLFDAMNSYNLPGLKAHSNEIAGKQSKCVSQLINAYEHTESYHEGHNLPNYTDSGYITLDRYRRYVHKNFGRIDDPPPEIDSAAHAEKRRKQKRRLKIKRFFGL